MPKEKDYSYLFGTIINQLLIKSTFLSNRRRFFICDCQCGNQEVTVRADGVLNGHVASCGCEQKRKAHEATFKDLTGQKFERLTVLCQTKSWSKRGATAWECLCTCGKTVKVLSASLIRGSTRSCGCFSSDTRTKRLRLEHGVASFNTTFYAYQHNAKRRGHEFALTKEEVIEIFKQNCFYCGSEPCNITKNRHNGGDFVYSGFDRVQNDKGYTIENVVPCCKICNFMKHELDGIRFIEHVRRICRHQRI